MLLSFLTNLISRKEWRWIFRCPTFLSSNNSLQAMSRRDIHTSSNTICRLVNPQMRSCVPWFRDWGVRLGGRKTIRSISDTNVAWSLLFQVSFLSGQLPYLLICVQVVLTFAMSSPMIFSFSFFLLIDASLMFLH